MKNFSFIFFLIIFCLFVTCSKSDCVLPNFPPEVEIAQQDEEPIGKLYREYVTLQLQCKKGFTYFSGDEFNTCVENEWEIFEDYGFRPAQPLICKKNSCPVVFLENGNISITDGKITYSCHDGFRLRGAKQAKCELDENGIYYVTADPPKCDEIPQCLKPRDSLLVVDKKCCFVGKLFSFSCPLGYKLQGRSLLTCYLSGRWNAPFPKCIEKPRCFLPNISNLIHEENKCCYAGNVYNFSCATGWDLEGSSSLECDENGYWLGPLPFCKKKKLCVLNPPIDGSVSITEKSIIIYDCKYGFRLKGSKYARCLTDNNGNYYLSQVPPICEAIPRCPRPEKSVLYPGNCCVGGYWYNFSCPNNFILRGSFALKCKLDGEWEGKLPKCQEKNTWVVQSGGNVKDDFGPVTFYFIVDMSGSIMSHVIQKYNNFIKMILQMVGFSRSERGIRMSIIIFSSEAKEIIPTSVADMKMALNFLEDIDYDFEIGKGSNLNLALQLLNERLISQFRDVNRRTSKTRVFLMSDGKITEGGKPYELATTIRSYETVQLYGIAVGQPDKEVLRNIICGVGVKCEKLFMLGDYEKLFEFLNAEIGDIIDFSHCGLERPNYISNEEMFKKRFKRSSKSNLARVVGGRQVQRPWPWLAALKVPDRDGEMKIQCGGAIIAEKWILTAAHCFRERKDKRVWLIVVGSTDLSLKSGIEFGVEEIIIHEDFSLDNLDFDIALVKLKEEIPYNFFIRPICLPPIYKELPGWTWMYREEEFVTVAGWGHDEAYSINETIHLQVVDHLKETEFLIQKKQICSKPVPYKDCSSGECVDKTATPTERMFCVGSELEGDGTCSGDGGGPLMQQVNCGEYFEDFRWFVVGIASWGVGCGRKGFYEYYTHVAKMREWINRKTRVQFEDIQL